jgi:alkanesulfonate monooxygenase SsuD/methylene tetrahydromethanopterin reductase-like flavin-dependent oxidoreductase (luciferase family)
MPVGSDSSDNGHINAAGSEQGRAFATKNANFLFTPALDIDKSKTEIAGLKEQARESGREVDVLTFSYVVCRPTRKEAEEYHHYYSQEQADWKAVDNIIELMFAHAQSFPPDMLRMLRDRMAAGHGGFPLVGTPDDVADGLEKLANAGFGGTTLAFVDYVKEFPYFRDEVLPRLEARGIRQNFELRKAS